MLKHDTFQVDQSAGKTMVQTPSIDDLLWFTSEKNILWCSMMFHLHEGAHLKKVHLRPIGTLSCIDAKPNMVESSANDDKLKSISVTM